MLFDFSYWFVGSLLYALFIIILFIFDVGSFDCDFITNYADCDEICDCFIRVNKNIKLLILLDKKFF